MADRTTSWGLQLTTPTEANNYNQPIAAAPTISGPNYDMNGKTYNAAGDVVGTTAPNNIQSGPTQEQLNAAKVADLRGGISNLINSATSIYDFLYGDLARVAGSQKEALQSRYNTETGALADQFNQELPSIGKGYAARGLYDSSYRQEAEGRATEGYQKQIKGVGDQLQADLGSVGQKLAQTQAQVQNDRGGLSAIAGQLGSLTDINDLTELKNKIDQQLRTVTMARDTNKTQTEFAASLNQAVPTTDRTGTLQTVLSNIIKGQAPRGLKIQTAAQIISGSSLTDEEKQRLTQTFNAQV